MNDQLELRIITQPYSSVYWGYFRNLVFGNSLTKHKKLSSFSYSVVIFVLPISHIPPCYHAKPPDVPRLIGPCVLGLMDEINVSSHVASLIPRSVINNVLQSIVYPSPCVKCALFMARLGCCWRGYYMEQLP